ncbi:MAG TPA: CocE/NonD family hydrolase [Candidatus Lokiarchaeia archaeon]|nr:CocE/NonD family hydrolase [Candidatus Lokiarchaeia archaeon]
MADFTLFSQGVTILLQNSLNNMFGQSLLFGLAGRLLFLFCFWVNWRNLARDNENSNGSQTWWKFGVKEACIVLVAMLNNWVAVFIFTYSVASAGNLLRATGVRTSRRRYAAAGVFLGIVTPIVGIATLFVIALIGNKLWWEFGMASAACAIAIPRRNIYEAWASVQAYFAHVQTNLWHRAPRWGKITFLLILAAAPVSIYGIFWGNIYAYSQEFIVPMRDGVRLRTRVYFPPAWNGTPRPVVMLRTPYNIETAASMSNVYRYTTQMGYITVLQDLRGCHGSEGVFPIFFSDANDGVDTVAWIMAQPWCSGKIATTGASAECANQICYQAEGPPGLVAAYLHAGPADLYNQWIYPGGCLRKSFMETWLPMVNSLGQYPILLNHALKDDYWQNVSLTMDSRYKNVNVRAVHVGGWYDCFAQGTVDSFYYYNYYGGSYAQGHQILVMGPWNHGGGVQPSATFPNDSVGFQFAQNAEQFILDESLGGKTQDWSTQPRVYYYVMGDNTSTDPLVNEWRTAMQWPVPGVAPEAWYFAPDGTLSNQVPSSAKNFSYLFDPSNPVQNAGGTTYLLHMGADDNAAVENGRSDILKFTTPVLTAPVEIVGGLNATLVISSNCTDTDFTAKLLDIYPDGRQIIVANGILKARYRDGFDPAHVSPMIPDNIYTLSIDMWSTAVRFVPGHRIQVSISSSDYPEFAVNDNTGGPVTATLGATYNIANNTLLCGYGATPSCIWFPRTA